MNKRLQELEQKRYEAWRVTEVASQAYRARQSELQQEARDKLEAEQVGLDYRAACRAGDLASSEWQKEKEAENIRNAEARLKYPEGTRLVEWDRPYVWVHGNYTKSKNIGLLQIFRRGDLKPTNQRSGCEPGKIIVRLLKADGSPSAKFEDFCGRWIPEGQDFPEEKA